MFGLLFFFVLTYLLSFLNFTLFLLILESGNLNYLSSLGVFSQFKAIRVVFLLCLLNLAGVPPTPTFFIKISMITAIYKSANTILATSAFVMNLFGMVFYLQCIRFLTLFSNKVPVKVINNFTFFNKSTALVLSIITLFNVYSPNLLCDILIFLECVFI